MPDCCRECEHWDLVPDQRVRENPRAECKLVLGSAEPLNQLAYVNVLGARLMTKAEYGCVQFKRGGYGILSTVAGGR
jgi:hypothetical protein